MDHKMRKCDWEKINDFTSYFEFDRFVCWMNLQIEDGLAKEIAVKEFYNNTPLFQEKWYLHVQTGQIWRLVWPDSPFTGIFEQVEHESKETHV